MKAAYKWRLDNGIYGYIVDESGNTPFIYHIENNQRDYSGRTEYLPVKENLISSLVSNMSKQEYETAFNNFKEFVLTKYPDTSFLDVKYYYSIESDECSTSASSLKCAATDIIFTVSSVTIGAQADVEIKTINGSTTSDEPLEYAMSFVFPSAGANIIEGDNIEITQEGGDIEISAIGYFYNKGKNSFKEGNSSGTASGQNSHVEGWGCSASGNQSHAEGNQTEALSAQSHSEGWGTHATNKGAHAEGDETTASGEYSHSEGESTTAKGNYAHAEGDNTLAEGTASHAEGTSTSGTSNSAHAEGHFTKADDDYAHAEGNRTWANAEAAHVEGNGTYAEGNSAHAEGYQTSALTSYSHAEGSNTEANGGSSHAEGVGTITNNEAEHADGKYNKSHNLGATSTNTRHSIGVGSSTSNRKNAIEVMENGDVYLSGVGNYDGIYVKGESGAPSGLQTLQETINTIDYSGKADKVLHAGANNFAALDGTGNLIDSYISKNVLNFVVNTLQQASASLLNREYLYVGETGDYEFGQTYKCVQSSEHLYSLNIRVVFEFEHGEGITESDYISFKNYVREYWYVDISDLPTYADLILNDPPYVLTKFYKYDDGSSTVNDFLYSVNQGINNRWHVNGAYTDDTSTTDEGPTYLWQPKFALKSEI